MLKIQSFTFNPFSENSFIIYHSETKEAIIVDPGCFNNSEEQELKLFIDKEKLTPIMLFNTHCHIDHVLGNRWVKETYKLDLIAHRLEEQILDWSVSAAMMYEIPYNPSPQISQFVNEGDTFQLGGEEIALIHCPGHSPGSLCMVMHSIKNIIGGDVLFRESIGRTDLPMGNFKDLESSIQNKLYKLPDDFIVYPGHGTETTIGYEKAHNAFVRVV
jgi:hydroxyacylglutathione hydrolase